MSVTHGGRGLLIYARSAVIGASLDTSVLEKVFGSLKIRAADWKDPFTEVGKIALAQFDHRFAVSGPGWAPNKKGTPTLIKTGNLRRSFSEAGDAKNLFKVGATQATFGSKLFYANILQRGGVIRIKAPKLGAFQKLAGLKRLPASSYVLPSRPIVVPPDSNFQQQIGRIAYSHFKAGIAAAL